MPRFIAAVIVVALAGCASQPHAAAPRPDPEPSVMAPPEPDASTLATDMAMFAERLRQVAAVVVADVLSPDYRDIE